MTRDNLRVLDGGLTSLPLEERSQVAKRESTPPREPATIDIDWGHIQAACRKVDRSTHLEPPEQHVHFAGFCWTGDDLEAFVRADEPRLPWWRVVARAKRWWKASTAKEL